MQLERCSPKGRKPASSSSSPLGNFGRSFQSSWLTEDYQDILLYHLYSKIDRTVRFSLFSFSSQAKKAESRESLACKMKILLNYIKFCLSYIILVRRKILESYSSQRESSSFTTGSPQLANLSSSLLHLGRCDKSPALLPTISHAPRYSSPFPKCTWGGCILCTGRRVEMEEERWNASRAFEAKFPQALWS